MQASGTKPAAIRRITLEGQEGAAAPVEEMGQDGIVRVRKVEQAILELYPVSTGAARGTFLVCPGGGYGIVAADHEGRAVAAMLNGLGFDVAVLLYRVNEGPDTRAMALSDAKKALALLCARGVSLGLNTRQVGLMGFSAGGHLVARLAHETPATPPDWLVLMYPAYLEKDGILLDEVAPVNTRAFVYVAADDSYAPSSRAFAESCKAGGVPCELHMPATGGHGFGLKAGRPESVRDWPERLGAFLRA